MRTNLVWKINCATCGHLLTIADDAQSVKGGMSVDMPKLETGACNSQHVISVKPCRNCVGRLRSAAQSINQGLDVLRGIPND